MEIKQNHFCRSDEKKLKLFVQQNQQQLLGLLQEMISLSTTNPPGNRYTEFVDRVVRWGQESRIEFQILEADEEDGAHVGSELEGPRFAILYHLKGTKGYPKLVFQGHYDTVVPTKAWVRDPFTPMIEEGRLYGLGSSDMKGGLASMIMACLSVKELGVLLSGDLYFLATPDEEFGSNQGLNYFLNKFNVQWQGAIVGEPSGIDRVIVGMKGGTWGYVTIRGHSCHGSQPQEGVNAFEKMVTFVSKAENELKPIFFNSVSHLSYVPEKNNHDTLMFGGTIEGSNTSRATVPDMCRVSFDLRTTPDEPPNRGEELIYTFTENFAKENPDLKIEVVFSSKMEGFTLIEKSELLTTLTQCIEESIGRKPLQSISSGALETYLFHKRGIPTLCFGPGSLALAHAPDEFVAINELISVTEIYALTAYRYLL